jgi:hypothetical protein
MLHRGVAYDAEHLQALDDLAKLLRQYEGFGKANRGNAGNSRIVGPAKGTRIYYPASDRYNQNDPPSPGSTFY